MESPLLVPDTGGKKAPCSLPGHTGERAHWVPLGCTSKITGLGLSVVCDRGPVLCLCGCRSPRAGPVCQDAGDVLDLPRQGKAVWPRVTWLGWMGGDPAQ